MLGTYGFKLGTKLRPWDHSAATTSLSVTSCHSQGHGATAGATKATAGATKAIAGATGATAGATAPRQFFEWVPLPQSHGATAGATGATAGATGPQQFFERVVPP